MVITSPSPQEIIKKLIRDKSLLALSDLSKKTDIRIEESMLLSPVLAHWMTLISIGGPQVHLTIKIQFSTAMARSFVQNGQNQAVPDSLSKDLIRELCNVIAGYVKQALADNQVLVMISLPLLSRGFDNFFLQASSRKESLADQWSLVYNQSVLHCSSLVEVAEEIKLDDFKEKESSSGEVEFF